MNFFGFGNVSQGSPKGPILREWSYHPGDVEKREPFFQQIDQVWIKGVSRPVFQVGHYEFRSTRDALSFYISERRSWLRNNSEYELETKFSRRRTKAERMEDIARFIEGIKAGFVSRLSLALSRPGPWDTVLQDSPANMQAHEREAAGADLAERLTSASGGEFELLALSILCPEAFKGAVDSLPEGETVEDHYREGKESAERSKEHLAREIQEAEKFLRNLPREE
ncbi:MAG: hypothetical protein KKH04_19130 [Proteobacteria bacterium]|nr:hypothetical protein [Pseudomonadota bacterium]